MKSINIYITGLFALLFLGACEDQLNIDQHGVTSQENFYKTDTDAEESLTAVYASLKDNQFNNFFLKNMLSDDIWCGGGSRGDNSDLEKLNEYTFGTSNTLVKDLFSGLYKIIYRSNVIIKNFTEESDTKKRVIAEAKVLRAMSYFDLVTLWGTPPLVLVPLEPGEFTQPNSTPEAIWSQIEQDLTEAINSGALMQKESIDGGIYNVSKETAQALLGKAYVFQEKWNEAALMLDETINSGLYGLYEGKYEDILRAVSDNNREILLEVNAINDTANPNNFFTLLNMMYGWRNDRMSSMWGGYGWAHDLYPMGWGFVNPQKGLYDSFIKHEGADGYRLQGTMKTYQQVMDISPMAPIVINDGVYLYGHQGFFMWKRRLIGSESIPNSWGCFHDNQRILRFAEVLLLAAEAHFMNGNTGQATDYVNHIRERAKLPVLNVVTFDDIKTEKRLELCMEGVRFQDLVRWKDASEVLGSQGSKIPVFYGFDNNSNNVVEYPFSNAEGGFKVNKHELLPFPEAEMNVNKKITQNPGW